jgi:predicted MPP superfamily phosphohydrolase
MTLRKFAGLVLAGFAVLALYAFWWEPSSLRLTSYNVPLTGAPALAGLKIAVLSDLHGGAPYIDTAKIDAAVAMTNAAKPDLILLTGDYVVSETLGARHMAMDIIAAHLKPLSAPLGVFAVLGNHDNWENAGRISASLRHAGIPVLENAHIVIPAAHGPLYLAGFGDSYTSGANPALALSGIPADADVICFAHSPDVFAGLSPLCALTVAGHTHGGQVVLPFWGPLYIPSSFGRRYAAGIVREHGRTLFVSTGIGTSIVPARFGVPPEISLLVLQ